MTEEIAAARPQHQTVYTIVETGRDRERWVECGVAFTNRDGSLNVILNALPVNGRLHVRHSNGRDRATEGAAGEA